PRPEPHRRGDDDRGPGLLRDVPRDRADGGPVRGRILGGGRVRRSGRGAAPRTRQDGRDALPRRGGAVSRTGHLPEGVVVASTVEIPESKTSSPESKEHPGFSTLCIHAGNAPDPTTGSVTVPIYQTSTYVQEAIGKNKGYEYARTQNPTRSALEENLTVHEVAAGARALPSGMAAITALSTLVKKGDHVVCSNMTYGGTYRYYTKILARYGVDFSFVDTAKAQEVERAIRPETRLLHLES